MSVTPASSSLLQRRKPQKEACQSVLKGQERETQQNVISGSGQKGLKLFVLLPPLPPTSLLLMQRLRQGWEVTHFFLFFGHAAWDLSSHPEMESVPAALYAWGLSHCTARDVPRSHSCLTPNLAPPSYPPIPLLSSPPLAGLDGSCWTYVAGVTSARSHKSFGNRRWEEGSEQNGDQMVRETTTLGTSVPRDLEN